MKQNLIAKYVRKVDEKPLQLKKIIVELHKN